MSRLRANGARSMVVGNNYRLGSGGVGDNLVLLARVVLLIALLFIWTDALFSLRREAVIMVATTANFNAQTSPWIISRSQDLTWFIGGSALVGLILIVTAAPGGALPAQLATLWWMAIDGPHVYSTTIRTLLDQQERRKYRYLWWSIVPLCAAGPLCAYVGAKNAFLFVLFLWSNFHIAKQHVGFVMLYRAKEKVRTKVSLEKWLVVGSLGTPILYVLAAKFGLDLLTLALFTGLCVLASYVLFANPSWRRFTLVAVNSVLWWAACIYAAQDIGSQSRILAATAAINVGHSLQYLRLNWFHNNNRYAQRGGLLGRLSGKAIFFFAAAFFIALPFRVFETFGSYFGLAAVGFLMLHFLLDARIWRVRGDKELATALRLNG